MTGGSHVTQLAGPPKMAVCVAVIAKEVRTRVGGRPCSALAFVLALRLPASLPLGPRRDEPAGFEDPRGQGSSGRLRPHPPVYLRGRQRRVPTGQDLLSCLAPESATHFSILPHRVPSHRPPGLATQHTQ